MVSISKGSGKMEGICSVNTSPLKNPFCNKMNANSKTICSKCYSRRMLVTARKNCNPAFEKNTEELSKRLLKDDEVPKIKQKTCRFHSHGELVNATHWKNFKRIAEKNPNTFFTLWTKRLNLIKDKPDNMQVIYSNPIENSPVTEIPEGCVGVYNVVSKEYAKAKGLHYNCGEKSDKCKICGICYTKGTPVGILYAETKEGMNGGKKK